MRVNQLELASSTHVGLVREGNEDALLSSAEQGFVLVADGMGGHRAGEVASQLAVETAAEILSKVQRDDKADELESLLWIGQSVEAANRTICAAAERQPAWRGMGTTLVAAMFRGNHIFYAHVGDSRLYRLRNGVLRQLTRDHSLVQQLLDDGTCLSREQAHEMGIGDNVLTRSLGLDPDVEVDIGDNALQADDLYLFCSDGLTGPLPNGQIRDILRARGRRLQSMAAELLDAALNQGARDNVTLVLARPRLNP